MIGLIRLKKDGGTVMKAKIDLEKFICSLMKRFYKIHNIDPLTTKCWLDKVLEDQDLEYRDGEIVEIESKDERIKKEILNLVSISGNENQFEEIKDWIEKLGYKPQGKTALEAAKKEKVDNANKVEPKFHEGEWVVDKQGIVHQIANVVENVTNHTYGYDVVGDGYFNDNTEGVRLWTIKDVKDGDVLASGHLVFIFKVIHGVWLNCHCSAHNDGSFIADSYNLLTNKYFSEVHPASKEQRDLLFAKMREEGYTFDFDKKELKKIEQSLANSAKIGKNDTLLDLLQKMPSCITVDEIDYHFVMKKTIFYKAYYEGEGEEGKGKVIFRVTAYSPIVLLTAMLEKLKEEGLLE